MDTEPFFQAANRSDSQDKMQPSQKSVLKVLNILGKKHA